MESWDWPSTVLTSWSRKQCTSLDSTRTQCGITARRLEELQSDGQNTEIRRLLGANQHFGVLL